MHKLFFGHEKIKLVYFEESFYLKNKGFPLDRILDLAEFGLSRTPK